MAADKTRWGVFFFVAAALLTGAISYCVSAFPAARFPALYGNVVGIAGMVLFYAVLLAGHLSYSRIHSVRAYFTGYSVGLTGTLYFLVAGPAVPLPGETAPAAPGFAGLCIALALLNLGVTALIPPSTKYRITRSITLGAAAAEAVLLVVFRFGNNAAAWVRVFAAAVPGDPFFWLVPVLFLAVLALSLWRMRREFFLGGIVAGTGLLLCAAWLAGAVAVTGAGSGQSLLFAGGALYCCLGIVAHGFFRMEHRLSFDPLLKIYNRDYCSRIITEQANLNVAPPFGVAMVDIDHFKQVNDTHGHQAGDAVLHAVAQAVEREAGDDAIACRYGGEELAVFFPQRTAPEVAAIGERIRAAVEKIRTRSGRKKIQVTVSIGVSHRESYEQPIAEVIQAADKALYAAKKGGRNQVRTQKSSLGGGRK